MYLVSKISCYPFARMEKEFKIFYSYEDAVYYKNKLKDACISEIANYYAIPEKEVYEYIVVLEDDEDIFAFSDMDLEIEEIEIAIDNLY